jgi:DtxR family Mn-dependent transcriptional regulator
MQEFDERPTPTIEDYLGVIYTLTRDGDQVISRKLAEWLEVSAPTVSATIRRMIRDGWVTMSDDKTIHLTPAGKAAAVSVVRRHMLTELLLARVLNVPWSRLHDEADRLEHDLSTDTSQRVASVVEDASVCPHGNPMPGHEALTEALIPLLEAEPGCRYTLARVHEQVERDAALMAFLEEHCLVPGAPVRIIKVTPVNETVTVQGERGETVVGYTVAEKLWVSRPHDTIEQEADSTEDGTLEVK